ncbi:hypothetical protein JXJ21_07990 [candidate division KSB1 bacterium]|nr:hypothetical protein [candidate division KSB1 bacterium]
MKSITLSILILALACARVFAGELDGGGHVLVSIPLGTFADVTKTGVGLGGKISYQPESKPWFSIRGDLGYLSYESTQRPVLAGGYFVTETIRSEGFHIGIGPQASLTKGAFKAYVGATAGLYYFQTVISYPELAYYYDYYLTDTRDSHGALGGKIGGGIMIDIGLGPWIDIGMNYGYIKNGALHTVNNRRIKKDAQEFSISIGVFFFSPANL